MTTFNRRTFLTALSSASAGLIVSNTLFASLKIDEYVQVEIAHGRLRGIRSNGVNIFKGIPYAGKTSGDHRFRRPAKLDPWKGVRDALQLGAPAIQPPNQTYGLNEPPPDEDCLFLNVWTPANDNKKRPVMFYNHGGGFATGSGGSVAQDGANLARYHDVVVVETNHRLGIMGYLYLDEIAASEYAGSGNMGMLDIVEALKWVHDNIEMFGGDPSNVMIWGESGGGAKTSCLYAMPDAAPFFNKASIESGPGIRMIPKEAATEMTAIVLKELNISPKDWRKLLEVPTRDLLALQSNMPALVAKAGFAKSKGQVGFVPGSFSPVVDGLVLPYHPFSPSAPEISKDKPLIVGWNEDEFTFFAMVMKDTEMLKGDFPDLEKKLEPQYGSNTKKLIDTYRETRPEASAADIWIAIQSMNMFGFGSVIIAERKAQQNAAPVYLYNLGYKSENKIPGTDRPLGSPHVIDITLKFRNELPGAAPGFWAGNRPERFVASKNMAEFWTSFARAGKPVAENAPQWIPYNLTDKPTMRIDEKCEVINRRFEKEIDVWRTIQTL